MSNRLRVDDGRFHWGTGHVAFWGGFVSGLVVGAQALRHYPHRLLSRRSRPNEPHSSVHRGPTPEGSHRPSHGPNTPDDLASDGVNDPELVGRARPFQTPLEPT